MRSAGNIWKKRHAKEDLHRNQYLHRFFPRCLYQHRALNPTPPLWQQQWRRSKTFPKRKLPQRKWKQRQTPTANTENLNYSHKSSCDFHCAFKKEWQFAVLSLKGSLIDFLMTCAQLLPFLYEIRMQRNIWFRRKSYFRTLLNLLKSCT